MHRLACVSLLSLGACSYTSAYVPPDDGRARLVWDGKQAVPYIPTISPQCASLVSTWSTQPPPPPIAGAPPMYWRPPPDVDELGEPGGVNAGVDVNVIVGGPSGPRGGPGRGGHGGGFHAGRGGGGHVGGGGGGGHGGGGDWGKGALALVVLAYGIIPTITVVWATQRPEETDVAKGLDQVNAFNDLVRSGEPACAGPR